jgi:DNA-binding transcriptional ArsR family regulator
MNGTTDMLTDKQIAKIREAFNGKDQRVIFKILGDRNRYRIFEMLGKRSQLPVSDIAKVLKISMPLASHHLKIMEQADMLVRDKEGQKVYYKLSTDNKIAQSISEYVL